MMPPKLQSKSAHVGGGPAALLCICCGARLVRRLAAFPRTIYNPRIFLLCEMFGGGGAASGAELK